MFAICYEYKNENILDIVTSNVVWNPKYYFMQSEKQYFYWYATASRL